jgi:HNH endonuclease
MIPDRDPARWRLDAVGNPVLYVLRGCHGTLCHEYDHIVPFSKGGKTTVSNCQILQTSVNRFKSNKVNLPMEELKSSSKPHRISYRDMDLIEYSVYGDVHRYNREAGVATTY